MRPLVVSGGVCAPLPAPRYDVFRLASPVEDAMPVLSAPRGAVRFPLPPKGWRLWRKRALDAWDVLLGRRTVTPLRGGVRWVQPPVWADDDMEDDS